MAESNENNKNRETVSDDAPAFSASKSTSERDTKKREARAKAEASEGEEKHCICDYRDYSTFMICCDQCGVWYHGSCVQVTRTMSNRIEKYFCSFCISKDSSLVIVYKQGKMKEKVVKKYSNGGEDKADLPKGHRELVDKIVGEKKASSASSSTAAAGAQLTGDLATASSSLDSTQQPLKTQKRKGCGNCIGCFRTANCGKCQNCQSGKMPCQMRVCVQMVAAQKRKLEAASSSTKSATVKGGAVLGKKFKRHGAIEKKARGPEGHKGLGNAMLAKAYNTYYANKDKREKKQAGRPKEKEEERQCYGPKCIYSARPESNYCSDACGMALAEVRLKMFLPERLAEFYGQRPAAEVRDTAKIQELAEEKSMLDKELQALNACLVNLTSWISSISSVKAADSDDQPTSDDASFLVPCAVCSSEVSFRGIGKHMQRCFVRLEKQSTFGAPHKLPTNPCNLYCEAYNKIDKTYCRRLRVMCSEHYKEQGSDDESKVCGCPLAWDKPAQLKELIGDLSSIDDGGGFCTKRRKQCYNHFNWEQTAVGLIDNERLTILQRQDEITEKIRQLKQKCALRGDVLSLLCNRTITHQRQEENPPKHESQCVPDAGKSMDYEVKIEPTSTERPTA